MRTLSPYFFMEVLVKKIHTVADKYATLNPEGTVIIYSTKDKPNEKQYISLADGKRIFEDLYGSIDNRWHTTAEFDALKGKLSSKRNSGKVIRHG